MKKQFLRIVVLCLCALALGACNLPNRDKAPVSTPTVVDLVEVIVAQTLTAMPTEAEVEIITPAATATEIPLPTETPLPTAEATATQQPTATATNTPVPAADIITGEPGSHFLHVYFDAINRGDYASAWNNLTYAYRLNMHDNLFSDFEEGYEDMDLCGIELSDIRVLTDTGSYAKIAAHYVYKVGADCTGYPYDFDAHFNYDAAQQRWLLDGLTKR
jgi:hypothetical protein